MAGTVGGVVEEKVGKLSRMPHRDVPTDFGWTEVYGPTSLLPRSEEVPGDRDNSGQAAAATFPS